MNVKTDFLQSLKIMNNWSNLSAMEQTLLGNRLKRKMGQNHQKNDQECLSERLERLNDHLNDCLNGRQEYSLANCLQLVVRTLVD